MSHKAFIGLGSNLDDPVKQIQQAFMALESLPQTRLVKCSGLYQTPALLPADNLQPQPDYINAVAQLHTDLLPCDLLLDLQNIERKHQRKRTYNWGPRTLDLDLLLYDQQIIDLPQLTVPHRRIAERAFVLDPLCEIDAGISIPGLGKASTLLDRLVNEVEIYEKK